MARPVTPITVEKDRYSDGTVIKHPAFGQITLHRLEGGGQSLYGSDFEHSRSVMITIHESELHRNLSHDWPHARKVVTEIRMSEAQWATFVSSTGIGEGVQCTLAFRQDVGGIPGFELPDRQELFNSELREKLHDTVEGFRKAIAQIDSMGLPKKKAADIKAAFERAIRELEANVPFVAETFSEHMEKTVDKAKAEIHGYMNATLQRAGLEALRAQQGSPLLIDRKTDNGEQQ